MKSHLFQICLIVFWLGGPVLLSYAALIMSSRCSREEEECAERRQTDKAVQA